MKMYRLLLLMLVFGVSAQAQNSVSLELETIYEGTFSELETLESVEWSPDGELLAVGGTNGVLLLDDNFDVQAHLIPELAGIATISWSPDSSRLVATSVVLGRDDVTAIINIHTGNYIALTHNRLSTPLVWSPRGEYIAFGLSIDPLIVIDAVTTEIIYEFEPEAEPTNRNYPVGMCWQSESILIATYGLYTYYFEVDAGNWIVIASYRGFTVNNSVECVAHSPYIVTADGQIFDTDTNEWLEWNERLDGFDVAWHPHESYVALNLPNAGVELRSIPSLDILATATGGMGEINGLLIYYDDSIHWHPDGELLAAVGQDNVLRVWRVSEAGDSQ